MSVGEDMKVNIQNDFVTDFFPSQSPSDKEYPSPSSDKRCDKAHGWHVLDLLWKVLVTNGPSLGRGSVFLEKPLLT